MGIGLIIIFSMLNSLDLMTKKKYMKDSSEISSSVNINLLISCCIAILYYWLMAKGDIRTNGITMLYSLIYAAIVFLSKTIEMNAYEKTSIINISVFRGAGSIIVPVLFGYLFYNETLTIGKVLAIALLTFVVCIPLLDKKGDKNSVSGYIYCLVILIIAGGTTIIYKLYGDDVRTMNENVFCFWTNAILFPIVPLIVVRSSGFKKLRDDIKRMDKKCYALSLLSVVVANTSTLISIEALKLVDIVVYTILQNSLTMLFAAILANILFKEKINKKGWISIIISIIAVILNHF